MLEELLLLLFFVLVGVGVGGVFSSPLTGFVVAVAIWVLLQFVRLLRFRRWLKSGAESVFEAAGFWGDFYRRVAMLRENTQAHPAHADGESLLLAGGTAALPDGMMIIDANQRIEWFNQAASDILQLVHPDDLGREITHLIRQSDFIAALENQQGSCQLKLNINDKYLTAYISSIGTKDSHLIVVQDSSRVRDLERARSDLLGNVAHELKTPLTVVSGYAEIISTQATADSKASSAAEQISKQAKRMNRIIDDLLMLERLEIDRLPAQKVAAVDVRLLAEEVIQELSLSMPMSRCTIKAEVETGAILHGDYGELYSMLSNLISNALRYSPEGGTVRVFWSSDADTQRLSVSDEGIGIAPLHLSRLTERFYRVDRSRSRDLGGTGLGLAIVKRVLQRHGASLRIESEPGEGSVFHCDFPQASSVSA